MAKGAAREPHVYFVGGRQGQQLAQITKNGIKQQGQHNAHAQNPQRGFALVCQHFVYNQLEEDGRRQAQHMHGHGRQENISKRRFLLQDFWNEPFKSKRLIGVSEFVLSFKQQHIAAPLRAKACTVHEHHHRLCTLRIQHGHLGFAFISNTHHDDGLARLGACDEGKHAILRQQTLPSHGHDFGFQTNVGGNAHEQQVAGLVMAQRIFSDHALRINLQPMVLGHCS